MILLPSIDSHTFERLNCIITDSIKMTSQFFLKTNQDIELFGGYPQFELSNSSANSKDNQVIASELSPCGRFFAVATRSELKVFTGDRLEAELLKINIKDVYSLQFSPSGNFLSTWERISTALTPDSKNCKVWFLNQGFAGHEIKPVYEYQATSQNNWWLQFSKLDDYVLRPFQKEIRIVKINTNEIDTQTHENIRVFDFENPFASLTMTPDNNEQKLTDFQISPSEHPTICTFTPEKGGKPAQLSIWPIQKGKINKKIASRTFFKADSCQIKWNDQGNAVLCVATTDFDASNKSYYGENTMYLLSFQGVNGTLGGNSVRVSLKSGPIHDFTWSPTSRQFGVISGFMPATIQFFDIKGNLIHSISEQRKNTMIFSPTGKYILLGGFGNLQGLVDILDRHDKFKSIAHFDASNTSVCKWSPGGEFIMTATTSPRLRVDNGVKIWHVSGNLVFVKEFNELLKVDWRLPINYRTVSPESHIIRNWTAINRDPAELALDPVLKGRAGLEIHSNVQEYLTKNPHKPATPKSKSGGGSYKPPHARRANAVGATKNSNTVPGITRPVPGMASAPAAKAKIDRNGTASLGPSTISPEEKKLRSLLKKLRAIEGLKERKANGDTLEVTQLQKIESEPKVLEELKQMGWTSDSTK